MSLVQLEAEDGISGHIICVNGLMLMFLVQMQEQGQLGLVEATAALTMSGHLCKH